MPLTGRILCRVFLSCENMTKIIYLLAFAVCYANAIVFDHHNRIQQGIVAVENQFPYAVSIQRRSFVHAVNNPQGHACGGVLISSTYALTAASCVTDAVGNTLSEADFRVFAGSISLAATVDLDNRLRDVANLTVPNSFLPNPAFINDIAIVGLLTAFTLPTIVPLALPDVTFDPETEASCTVAGWGVTSNTTPALANTQLTFADKYVYGLDLCTFVYNPIASEPNIFNTMVCAASRNIRSSGCTGDLGNALVCNGTLTGILFRYTGCDAVTSHPELYTRVSNYTTWIRTVTGAGYSFTPTICMFFLAAIVQIFASKSVY